MTEGHGAIAGSDPALDRAVQGCLGLWGYGPDATARLINLSENHTYLVEQDGAKAVLRVHRPGTHPRADILSELAWMTALKRDGALETPDVITGVDGSLVQQADLGEFGTRFAVLFAYVPGASPGLDDDLQAEYEILGGLAAHAHLHAISWTPPPGFNRVVWSAETLLGPGDPIFGDWRDCPHARDPDNLEILEQVEAKVRTELEKLGTSAQDFGLIHADMRLANILVDGGDVRVIDFDDCGTGWFLYDFAAAVSFLEADPRVRDYKAAWLRGYRLVRDLPASAEGLLDTFMMFRRFMLLAWIGSRIESAEPRELAPYFARVSAQLGRVYLKGDSLPGQ